MKVLTFIRSVGQARKLRSQKDVKNIDFSIFFKDWEWIAIFSRFNLTMRRWWILATYALCDSRTDLFSDMVLRILKLKPLTSLSIVPSLELLLLPVTLQYTVTFVMKYSPYRPSWHRAAPLVDVFSIHLTFYGTILT